MEAAENHDRFKVVRIVASTPIKTSRMEGSVDLIIQQRKKDNGKFSRQFLSFRLDVGGRTLFLHPEAATEINEAMGGLLPQVADVQSELLEAFNEKQRRWDAQKSKKTGVGGLSQFTEGSKTERSKAKGDVKGKRAEKIERDRSTRQQMKNR